MKKFLFSLVCASILFSATDEASAGKKKKDKDERDKGSSSKVVKNDLSNKCNETEKKEQKIREIVTAILQKCEYERKEREELEWKNRVVNHKIRKELFPDEM